MTRKIQLFRRTYSVKGKTKPTSMQGTSVAPGSMTHTDELLYRYDNIFEARQALTWFQDNAEGCSYYLRYPQSVIYKHTRAHKKLPIMLRRQAE